MAKQKRKVAMPAGIRNKMMAAVSMLMVSCIMMVSSTYAWFTLSTAPEVKNISTTVAGNGSLEIALMPASGEVTGIKSGYASTNNGGTVRVPAANNTWGNIIYLNDEAYGLNSNSFSLNPALLNVDDTGAFNDKNPLVVANYGYDGRVATTTGTTVLKSYVKDATADNPAGFSSDGYGVRVIGETKSGESVLESTYGYAIDLAFRLNSANSTTSNGTKTATAGKLLLQTEATQRIYESSPNSATEGGGSYMSFNPNGTGLDADELLGAIRVTFVKDYGRANGDAPEIVGNAKLDTLNAKTDANGTTAKLYLYDADGNPLKDNAAVIVDTMEKNAAVQVSAIVWLDGTAITNASVSALKGALAQTTLNLQFSTDVDLKPASNNTLMLPTVAD